MITAALVLVGFLIGVGVGAFWMAMLAMSRGMWE